MRPIQLDVGSEECIPPVEFARLAEGLRAALHAAGAGEVTGSETFPTPNACCLRCVIHIEAMDLEAAVRVLRHALRYLEAPAAT